MYGIGKGLSWKPTGNYANNTAWAVNGYSAPIRAGNGDLQSVQSLPQYGSYPANEPFQEVFYNYLTHTQDLSLQGVFTLNNIRFHKAKTGLNLYGFAGIGGSIYRTYVNALNSDGVTPYNFEAIVGGTTATYKNRHDIRKALRDAMDKSYETKAQSQGDNRPKLFFIRKIALHIGQLFFGINSINMFYD